MRVVTFVSSYFLCIEKDNCKLYSQFIDSVRGKEGGRKGRVQPSWYILELKKVKLIYSLVL